MRDILNKSQCISALEDVILHIHAIQYVAVDKPDSAHVSILGLLHLLFRHIGGRNVKDSFPAWTILHLGFIQALGGFLSMVRLLLGRIPEGGFLLLVSAKDLWERHGFGYKYGFLLAGSKAMFCRFDSLSRFEFMGSMDLEKLPF